jgi:hypothetical protein
MSRRRTEALLDRLSAADPAARAPMPDAGRRDDIREAILSQAATPPPARPPAARVRPGRRWGPLTGGAVALTAAAAVLLSTGDPSHRASAAAVLEAAAERLAAQPSLVPAPGQYYYRRAEGHDYGVVVDLTATTIVRTRVIHEIWIGPDGSGRIVRRDLDPQVIATTPPSAAGAPGGAPVAAPPPRPAAASAPAPGPRPSEKAPAKGGGSPGHIDEREPPGTMVIPFGSGSLSMAEFLSLPTDPTELAARIEAGASRNSHPLAYQELDLTAEALRNAPVPPALGAALYQALALLPGIEALGERTDALGRRGQAVGAADASGIRMELIIDPATGMLLADRDVATVAVPGLGAEPGDVIHEYTYVARGVVDSVRERVR